MKIQKITALLLVFLISLQCVAKERYLEKICLSPQTILPVAKYSKNSEIGQKDSNEHFIVKNIKNAIRSLHNIKSFMVNKPAVFFLKSLVLLFMLFSPSILFAQVSEESLIRSYLNYSSQTELQRAVVASDAARIDLAEQQLLPAFDVSLTPSLTIPTSISESGEASVDNHQLLLNGDLNLNMPSFGGSVNLDVQRNRKGETTVALSYQQELLRGGPLNGITESEYNLEDARAQGEQNSIQISLDLMDNIKELRILFWQLYVYDQMIKESRLKLSEFVRALSFENRRDSLGVGSRDEVLRAELLKVQFERYVENLAGEYAVIQQRISGLTGVEATSCTIEESFSTDINSLPGMSSLIDSLDQSLKLRFSELNISRSVLLEEFNRNDGMSSLALGPAVGFTDGSLSGTGQQFFAGATLTFTPNWGAKSKARISSTQTTIARLENVELKREMSSMVNTLYTEWNSLAEQYRLIQEELMIATERYHTVAEGYYKTGRYQTAKEVLESLFSLIEKQREAIEMIYRIKSIEIKIDNISGYLQTRFPFIAPYTSSLNHSS